MTSIRVWYILKFTVELSCLLYTKLEEAEHQKLYFNILSLSETWNSLPEVSLSTSQTLSMPMCCVYSNPRDHVNHCDRTINTLHLSLFLFEWVCVCLHLLIPLSYIPILYIHLFLPTPIQKTCDSTITRTPVIFHTI